MRSGSKQEKNVRVGTNRFELAQLSFDPRRLSLLLGELLLFTSELGPIGVLNVSAEG